MDASTIREKINKKGYETNLPYPTARKYPENHVFDEEKSVKWNKEEVVRQNKLVEEEKEKYKASQAEKSNEFDNDVITYILDNYSIDNKAIANKIFSKAYSDGHSGGYYEILNEVMDLADFVDDILVLVK